MGFEDMLMNLLTEPKAMEDLLDELLRVRLSYVRLLEKYMKPEDMAEIGVDVWQGVIPDNDIVSLQKKLKGSMVLMGGIDSRIDHKDWTEEEVRRETRRACSEYGKAGSFIPCLTYGI